MASVYEQMFNNATVLVTNFVETTKHEAASFYAGVDRRSSTGSSDSG